ncbi:transposase domain-containing protein [Salinivibrio sharmensis]|uniref:transposase domain-containing protein n=1 Tax=Salinivibrio sharmensis TaxID=390883 RepID=UPI00105516FE|nr:transposase domain-containing protein [Salinivibrio sharmensis]
MAKSHADLFANGVEHYVYLCHALTELPQLQDDCDITDLLTHGKKTIFNNSGSRNTRLQLPASSIT